MHQLSFEDATFYTCKKGPCNKRLLSVMDSVIPWKDMVTTVERHSPKGELSPYSAGHTDERADEGFRRAA